MKTHRKDTLDVLKPLATDAEDVHQVVRGDSGVDRVILNKLCHFDVVSAFVPDVADLNKDTVVADNPCQLISRFHRLIVLRIKH